MFKSLIATNTQNYAAFISRVFLGFVMFPHGAQKLFGWFGGYGFEGSMEFFTQEMGLPWLIGFLVILIECIGAFLLVIGLASRLMAFALVMVSVGIIITSINDYFFMNWFGTQPAEGYEFFLLMIGLGLSVMITGGGALSIDGLSAEGKAALRLESERNAGRS